MRADLRGALRPSPLLRLVHLFIFAPVCMLPDATAFLNKCPTPPQKKKILGSVPEGREYLLSMRGGEGIFSIHEGGDGDGVRYSKISMVKICALQVPYTGCLLWLQIAMCP